MSNTVAVLFLSIFPYVRFRGQIRGAVLFGISSYIEPRTGPSNFASLAVVLHELLHIRVDMPAAHHGLAVDLLHAARLDGLHVLRLGSTRRSWHRRRAINHR